MNLFFKRLYWSLLPEGWYFVALDVEDVMRPAFWNGVVWENRIEVLDDLRVRLVAGRIPAQGGAI